MADIVATLENVKRRISSIVLERINSYRRNLKYLSETGALSDPSYIVNDRRMELIHISEKLDMITEKRIDKAKTTLVASLSKLEALNPLAVVARGYCVVSADGVTLKSVEQVNIGEKIDVKIKDGTISATVNEIRKEK